MARMILLAALTLTSGCGVVEGVKGMAVGVVVREHETDHLLCATARIGEAASISCVRKGN